MKKFVYTMLILLLVILLVFPASALSSNVERSHPEYVESGEWFTVEVTFTCPEDETNSIGIADNLEVVDAEIVECSPSTSYARTVFDNPESQSMVECIWAESFDAGTEVTAVYEVIIEGEPMDEFVFEGYVLYYAGSTTGYGGRVQIREDIPETSVKIKPDMSYALGEVNRWLQGEISMSDALSVINAWLS